MTRVELLRQAKRRRTLVALGLLVGLPVLLAVILVIVGGPKPSADQPPMLIDVATRSGLNFAFFVLAASAQFALVVVVALFCGDTVASEASWGSLRYLLVRPVARARLLRTKLVVAVLYSLVALVAVPASSLAAGTVAFGWHGLQAPVGLSLEPGTATLRLVAATAYVGTQLAAVGALAFFFSVVTDAPLGAVGGAVMVVIVFQILDAITSLGAVRSALPTHYGFAWLDLLSDPVPTGQMTRGILVQIVWTAVLLVAAFLRFRRKDILS